MMRYNHDKMGDLKKSPKATRKFNRKWNIKYGLFHRKPIQTQPPSLSENDMSIAWLGVLILLLLILGTIANAIFKLN